MWPLLAVMSLAIVLGNGTTADACSHTLASVRPHSFDTDMGHCCGPQCSSWRHFCQECTVAHTHFDDAGHGGGLGHTPQGPPQHCLDVAQVGRSVQQASLQAALQAQVVAEVRQ
eukprot:1160058-Pelagomonas_calceolata.AAC.12